MDENENPNQEYLQFIKLPPETTSFECWFVKRCASNELHEPSSTESLKSSDDDRNN